MPKPSRSLWFCLGFLAFLSPGFAETRWYRSNASGMALEPLSSALALREDYALSISDASPEETPALLLDSLEEGFSIEIRVLWEKGQESRRLWVFRDDRGTRLSAAFNTNPLHWPKAPERGAAEDSEAAEGEEEADSTDYGGYIEIYNAEGFISEERRFEADREERITRFTYAGKVLIRADTWIRPPPQAAPEPAEDGAEEGLSGEGLSEEGLSEEGPAEEGPAEESPATESRAAGDLEPYCTDYFYYNRALSLRAVERRYHRGDTVDPLRLSFSHRLDQATRSIAFENPQSALSSEHFDNIIAEPGASVLYTTDTQGRVLTETRKNQEGEVTGELINTWAGSRLESIRWSDGEDERRTEYEYNDAGDRIIERDYNRGVLERVVRREGDREIEELYMNNRVILRAIWEKGRKISEERVREEAR
ncbi:MAG: hypothetical protein LBQ35_09375 [Spirochaetaceae bacterium]|nr:hypothetical protein [Spirochaetaceae bacterium]